MSRLLSVFVYQFGRLTATPDSVIPEPARPMSGTRKAHRALWTALVRIGAPAFHGSETKMGVKDFYNRPFLTDERRMLTRQS
jgi:hypothetical protein